MDRILASAECALLLEEYPKTRVAAHVRMAVAGVRTAITEGGVVPGSEGMMLYVNMARQQLVSEDEPSLQPVINATGVVLHTNLGRAPLSTVAVEAMGRVAAGYSNLEFDLDSGRRGSRYVHSARLLCELTGAEDALVVNNCAAALVLAMNTVAEGGGVVVSRGELVEIGGGFRIPEMLRRAGARLLEVGSTNRTRVDDYRAAIAELAPAAILKVHRSNFRISGFTAEVEVGALAEVAREAGIPLIHDLGSGLLVGAGDLGLPEEPGPGASLDAGADLVVFSGDKLLGGPQAGLVIGCSRVVAPMRENPLCRAFRVDKATLAGLEATLRLYRDPPRARKEIPTLRMLSEDPDELQSRALALAEAAEAAGVDVTVVESRAAVGGGTYPGVDLPSRALRLAPRHGSVERIAERLRSGQLPVVARREEGALLLDLRAVLPEQDAALLERLLDAVGEEKA